MSKKYLITYRLNASNHRRINLWIENPLTGYEDVEMIEAYLNEHHAALGDIVAEGGCKIFAFSHYDLPDNADPFADNDQALLIRENDIMPEILNESNGPKSVIKMKPKLTLIRGKHKENVDE